MYLCSRLHNWKFIESVENIGAWEGTSSTLSLLFERNTAYLCLSVLDLSHENNRYFCDCGTVNGITRATV